jgi:hypothetical protein
VLPLLEPTAGGDHRVACHNPVPDAELVAAGLGLGPDADGDAEDDDQWRP